MNKTDFQNGYALGFVSGGTVKVGKSLPDWDDDSPVIANGVSTVTNNVVWELTEKGTFRWKVVDQSASVKRASLGSVQLNAIPLEYKVIASKIKQIDVEDGITSVGLCFAVNCERVRIPESVTTIVVAGMFGIKDLDFRISKTIEASQFENHYALETIAINQVVTTINQKAFNNCYSLKEFDFSNITAISVNSFANTISLSGDIVLGSALKSINTNAFSGSAIKSVRFQNTGTLPTIQSTSFSNCPRLKDIYCPWDEGAVANAPWGAIGTTIHYNCVEGV